MTIWPKKPKNQSVVKKEEVTLHQQKRRRTNKLQ
jgi:hypothetical protein